jgi:hypothetical protein
VIEAAKTGDLKATELILARIWPPRRGRPVHIDLPAVRTTTDVADGMAVVVEAMAAGEVTPEEAATSPACWRRGARRLKPKSSPSGSSALSRR